METILALKVRFTLAGFHYWPEAPAQRAYLKARHRHLFHFQVEVVVPPNSSRHLEFHDLMEVARSEAFGLALDSFQGIPDFDTMSCEQIASTLLKRLDQKAPPGTFRAVEAWEDGECGARVESLADLPVSITPGPKSERE